MHACMHKYLATCAELFFNIVTYRVPPQFKKASAIIGTSYRAQAAYYTAIPLCRHTIYSPSGTYSSSLYTNPIRYKGLYIIIGTSYIRLCRDVIMGYREYLVLPACRMPQLLKVAMFYVC